MIVIGSEKQMLPPAHYSLFASFFSVSSPYEMGSRQNNGPQGYQWPNSQNLWICHITWQEETKFADGNKTAHRVTLK